MRIEVDAHIEEIIDFNIIVSHLRQIAYDEIRRA